MRIDSTVVEANIHEPSDSTLVWDGVLVLTRLLEQPAGAGFTAWRDHTKVTKRRMLAIQRANAKEKRVPLYRDLVKVAGKVLGDARAARDVLADSAGERLRRPALG